MSTRRQLLPGHIRTYSDNRRAPIKQRLGAADVSLRMAGNDLSQSGKWRNFRYLVVAGQGNFVRP
jgi:hypothetical protein